MHDPTALPQVGRTSLGNMWSLRLLQTKRDASGFEKALPMKDN